MQQAKHSSLSGWSCRICQDIGRWKDWWTHQEAHEVQGQDGGHPTERQALQHRATDPGRVTEVPGRGIGRQRRAALGVGAPLNAPHCHDEKQCFEHHCSMLVTCGDNSSSSAHASRLGHGITGRLSALEGHRLILHYFYLS